MLTFTTGERSGRMCDGISRRDFIRVGSLGAAGLTLADLLRWDAQGAAATARKKSVIMVYLYGGLSHTDTYDMKPDAPSEFRGEFKPVATRVPGMPVCELLPRHAEIADKIAIVNGLKTVDTHSSWVMITGYPQAERRPTFGAAVSHFQGSNSNGLPAYVSLPGSGNKDVSDPSYAGTAHRPFRPTSTGLANLQRLRSVSMSRLEDRKQLLKTFDGIGRNIEDLHGNARGHDAYVAQALEMIGSSKAREAFDVKKEPESVRNRYGAAVELLAALRLVSAGVRVVTLTLAYQFPGGSWDGHVKNFKQLRQKLPPYDQALHALITDIHARGLDKDVLLVVCGEFGRTPKINRNAGRDHWPACSSILLSGGGLQMGQAIGTTTRRGEQATGQPFTAENMLATVYHHMGIDPSSQIIDFNGRPRHLLDNTRPIHELL